MNAHSCVRASFCRGRQAWTARLLALGVLLCVLVHGGAGCRRDAGAAAGRVRVFAAASLTEPFGEIARSFEQVAPPARVELSFASTHQLLVQLDQGADADVYATADSEHMRDAERRGLVEPTSARVLTRNRLALIVPRDNPGQLESLPDLGRAGVRLVVAHPNVPAGRYALRLLDALRADPTFGPALVGQIESNVVSHEVNVKAVLAKVRLGEADAGLVYASDAVGSAAPEVRTLALPSAHNPEAHYEIAVLRGASNPLQAGRFVDYALSSAGQQHLVRAGLLPALAAPPEP